jgi:polyisoprenoid-binding protein YceI
MHARAVVMTSALPVLLPAAAWTGAGSLAPLGAPPAGIVSTPIESPGWPIDRAHSRVTFTVTKWDFVEVEGRFFDFTGTIAYAPGRPEASHVDWRVRVASVETGAPRRDKALQSAEYFDAARYPEMRFVSDRVTVTAPNQLEVHGVLTIRGQSKPIIVPVAYGGVHTIPGEGTFEAFQTEFTLNRNDYGVKGGTVLGLAISSDVHVKLTAVVNHP